MTVNGCGLARGKAMSPDSIEEDEKKKWANIIICRPRRLLD